MHRLGKALEPNADIVDIQVESTSAHPDMKKMGSLLNRLVETEQQPLTHNTSYALPIVLDVPLLNLTDQMKKAEGFDDVLTEENILKYKPEVKRFLRRIWKDPNEYKQYTEHMDGAGQGISQIYSVIRSINRNVNAGRKFYIAGGNAPETSIKHLAKERGLGPELYHYIATGNDSEDVIHDLIAEVKERNWVNLNLLTLAKGEKIGITNASGEKYIFSADNPLLTRFSRGAYNFHLYGDLEK